MKKPAQTKKPAKKIGGPFLAAAVFCENIMEEMGGFVTPFRILDTIQALLPSTAPADMPSKDNPVEFRLNALVTFRTGDAVGKHTVVVILQSPSGKRKEVQRQEVEFLPQPQSAFIMKTQIVIKATTSGVFWFDIILDGKRYTRMPLKVSIEREGGSLTAPEKKKNK